MGLTSTTANDSWMEFLVSGDHLKSLDLSLNSLTEAHVFVNIAAALPLELATVVCL